MRYLSNAVFKQYEDDYITIIEDYEKEYIYFIYNHKYNTSEKSLIHIENISMNIPNEEDIYRIVKDLLENTNAPINTILDELKDSEYIERIIEYFAVEELNNQTMKELYDKE